jgi:hypothetical protein
MPHHGKFILLFMVSFALMGMGTGAEQQAEIKGLTACQMSEKGVMEITIQNDTNRGSTQAPPYEFANLDAKHPLIVELAPESSSEKWADVRRAIATCAKLDLTVWYAFGSLRMKMEPEGQQCRMNIIIEGEITENGQKDGFTCIGDSAVFNDLDLAHDGQALRQRPPAELPETLKPFCKHISSN